MKVKHNRHNDRGSKTIVNNNRITKQVMTPCYDNKFVSEDYIEEVSKAKRDNCNHNECDHSIGYCVDGDFWGFKDSEWESVTFCINGEATTIPLS